MLETGWRCWISGLAVAGFYGGSFGLCDRAEWVAGVASEGEVPLEGENCMVWEHDVVCV